MMKSGIITAGIAVAVFGFVPGLAVHAGESTVNVAWRRLLTEFRSERTGLVYEHCSEGDATRHLPRPDEIALNAPIATGWNTGMEDGVLNGCPLLLAALRRKDADAFAKLYPGIMRCATISGKPGFLARSISPFDGKSFYYNSSRDQYTLFVYTMWRVYSCPFATEEMKADIRRVLADIAAYCEKCVTAENGYELLRFDGKAGIVAKMWTAKPSDPPTRDQWGIPTFDGISPHESERLPMIYAAAHAVTGETHWREQELKYADTALAIAEAGLPPFMPGFTLYQMQVSQRLLWECERDPVRKNRYRKLLQSTAALATNCYSRVETRLKELDGRLDQSVGDWRTWPKENCAPNGELNGLPYRKPVRPKDFAKAYDVVREAGEAVIVRALCPGLTLTADEVARFRTFVRTSGFERHNSSGLVYPVLAETYLPDSVDGDHTVFAHYMTCFARSVDSYKREILLAQQYGVDGWALNCGNWKKKNAAGEWVPHQGYVVCAERIHQAAKELGTDFKLFFSPDGSLQSYTNGNHATMLTDYLGHPNQFTYDGKPFISGWAGGLEKYDYARRDFEARGVTNACIVPQLGPRRHVMYATKDLVQKSVYRDPLFKCDGAFLFGCDNTSRELTEYLSNSRYAALVAGKIFMAGPCPAYNSANLRDYHGMAGYASEWQAICADQPELIEIVTWNDYAEDSGLMPGGSDYHPKQIGNRVSIQRDDSFLDLTAYYVASYKSGGISRLPEQDKIYTAYRTRPVALSKIYVPDPPEGEARWVDMRDTALQVHDDVQDNVYATVALTAPAEVTIEQKKGWFAGKTVTRTMPAGIHTLEAPMVPGTTPHFIVRRDGKTLIDVWGRRMIVENPTVRNSFKLSYAGTHRVWTGGSVAGEPVIEFQAGERVGDDLLVAKLPDSLPRGSYNFRVRYANDEDDESRYTLVVDVPWMDPKAANYDPVILPLYLPPTGGEVREQGFLFTLPPGATTVRIEKTTLREPLRKRKNGKLYTSSFDYSDYGTARIESLALIPNRIAKKGEMPRPYPEMVTIPGGTFTMGAKAIKPDEGGPRTVTLSPFQMGKYEVTNREFEEFMPEHRSHRSDISWRDRDPVVYVSWCEAAEYCNWLSAREGLAEAYDVTNNYALVKGANGYRLPTEAEWEYVATGRGENRTYPWGDEPPTYELCNAAPSDVTLQQEYLTRPARELKTAPVGSYPKGVSRDGVYDLAGNVCEWCSDQYHHDRFVEGKDPVCTEPARSGRMNFKAIRGGSFGYYNMSQRCCDREFNNPRYPGYIYIGFRVVKPQ